MTGISPLHSCKRRDEDYSGCLTPRVSKTSAKLDEGALGYDAGGASSENIQLSNRRSRCFRTAGRDFPFNDEVSTSYHVR